MNQELLQQAITALTPLLMALLGWLSILAARWINAKVRDEHLKSALLRLDESVYVAVREIQQTVIDDLREKAEDGRIDPDEASEAKDKAIAAVKDYLGKNGMRELERVLEPDAIKRLIEGKVETAVHEMKGE